MRENLTRVLVPHVADGLWSIYENAKTACERNKQPEKTLQTFQNLLTSVTKWTPETLKKEVERITVASKCDYIEDLLLGVFVSYIRAFASLQQNDATHVNIDFERPSLETFVHNFYVVSARKCWTQAYLFNTIQVPSTQQARNRRDIEVMLDSTVGEVVDSFIPWRGISQAYFQKREEAPRPTTAAPPPVSFAPPEVHEFETDDEESEEERPKITLGEDIVLTDDEEDVDTEDELERKATETVALNL